MQQTQCRGKVKIQGWKNIIKTQLFGKKHGQKVYYKYTEK